jgi:hypothetical protein
MFKISSDRGGHRLLYFLFVLCYPLPAFQPHGPSAILERRYVICFKHKIEDFHMFELAGVRGSRDL